MKTAALILLALTAGCAGGHDFTRVELEIEAPQIDEPLPPISEASAEQFDVAPAPEQYQGGYAVTGYGSKSGAARFIQDGGETTWTFDVEGAAPTAEQLATARRAFAYLGSVASNWSFVELEAPNAQTDIVIKLSDPEKRGADGCYDALASGVCWFASAGCTTVADVETGSDDVHVCERYHINVGQHGVDGFAESAGLERAELWETVFIHEIGHTLGLNHAPRGSNSIMKATLPIVGWLGRTVRAPFSPCELAKLQGYLPMPGALSPLEWRSAPECE